MNRIVIIGHRQEGEQGSLYFDGAGLEIDTAAGLAEAIELVQAVLPHMNAQLVELRVAERVEQEADDDRP